MVLLLILPKKYIIVYPTASLHEGKDVKKMHCKNAVTWLHDWYFKIDILCFGFYDNKKEFYYHK